MSVKLVIECETIEELVSEINKLKLPGNSTSPPAPKQPEGEIIDIQPEPEGTDEQGMYWDERIHSSSKKKTAKGLWKQKRGVSPVLVQKVKDEQLQAGHKVSEATIDVPPPPPPPAPVDFNAIMLFASEHEVTLDDLNVIARGAGFDNIGMVSTDPSKIPAVFEALKSHVG